MDRQPNTLAIHNVTVKEMKKKEKRMLLLGLGGLAAIYLLTRPKSQVKPISTPPPRYSTLPGNATAKADVERTASAVASVGYPYRNATV